MPKKTTLFHKLPVAIAVAVIITISYWQIFNSFFQQDEWLGFARFILLKDSGFLNIISYALTTVTGHYVPLALLAVYGIFSLFNLNYFPYALISLLLHLTNVLLTFYFAKLLTKDAKLALLAAVLFGISSSNYQATAWTIADLSVHSATIFGLLSLIFILKFLETKIFKFFLVSVGTLLISLLFKEIAVGFFIFFPALFYLRARIFSRYQREILIIVLIGLSYVIFRSFLILIASPATFVVASAQSPALVGYNLVTVPLKALAQTIVPVEISLAFSYQLGNFLPTDLTGVKDTPLYNIFIEKRILELVSISIFLLVGLVLFVTLKRGNKPLNKIAIVSFLFVIINSFIFAFSPERAGIINLIDSRNLYLPSIGTATLIATITASFLRKNLHQVFLMVILLVIINTFFLESKMTKLAAAGTSRKDILTNIKNFYPKLPDKVIFYTESDKSFYGLESSEKILPFQSGFGQTLLAWYHDSENFPKKLYEDRFLWEITSQGYREADMRGFGYFRDFNLLAKTVRENNLSLESIKGLRYDSEKSKVEDNTEEIKGRLTGFFAKKNSVDLSQVTIFPSHNQADVNLMVDGLRQTFWNSRIAYSNPQSIKIDLKTPREITKIELDSFNSISQGEVGYRVFLSKDGGNWQEVFHAKRSPPAENGYVEIYFQPTWARFIEIRQQGFHRDASWVVHELMIYEKVN